MNCATKFRSEVKIPFVSTLGQTQSCMFLVFYVLTWSFISCPLVLLVFIINEVRTHWHVSSPEIAKSSAILFVANMFGSASGKVSKHVSLLSYDLNF